MECQVNNVLIGGSRTPIPIPGSKRWRPQGLLSLLCVQYT